MRHRCVFFLVLLFAVNLVAAAAAPAPTPQVQHLTPETTKKQFVYVVAQGYFPNIPAEAWSSEKKISQFMASMDVNNTTWSPWPILVCMQIDPNTIKIPMESFLIKRKKFSISTVLQVKTKENKLVDYPGALLTETYQVFTSNEDFVEGFPKILYSPSKGHFMTVFVNFELNPILDQEISKIDSKLLQIQMFNIEEGWSEQKRKDALNFMRRMMQQPIKQ